MAENSLFPFFVRLYYTSAFAPHVMTLPIVGWTPGVDVGDFDTVGGGSVPAQDAIDDFVTLLKPFFPVTTDFTHAFVYSMASPTADAIPEQGISIASGVGTEASPGWTRAVSATFNYKTDAGGDLRIVLLDCNTDNNFDPVLPLGLGGPSSDFNDFMLSDDCWITGRDGGRPQFLLRITNDLNDALRKQYHMG